MYLFSLSKFFFCHLLQLRYIHVVFQVMLFHSLAQRIQTCPLDKVFIGFILIPGYGKNGLYHVWWESLWQQILRRDFRIFYRVMQQGDNLLFIRKASATNPQRMKDIRFSGLIYLPGMCMDGYSQGFFQ